MRKKVNRQVGDKTRADIIKAAYKLFAKFGFSGTTTQAIAEAAKVNETLIFHHFGSKTELWKKVKASVIDSVPIEPLDTEPKSLRAFLETLIKQRLLVYQPRPNLIRLLQWQRLESRQNELSAGNILAPKNWLTSIKYLQKNGKINATVQPEIIITWLQVSINAMIFDNIPFLQYESNRAAYIECLLSGFERVFE